MRATRAFALLVLLPIARSNAQERRLYVADVVGAWEVLDVASRATALAPLSRLPPTG